MDKLKIGVIGTGHLGRLHTSLYTQIEEADLIGIYDIDKVRSQAVAKEFNVPHFSDLGDLIEKVDAVSVVVPTSYHYEVTKKVLNHGVHCLIEKPITVTIKEADELIDLARKNELTIQIGHIERFNPAICSLDGRLINPMFIESHRLASFNPRGTDVAVVLDLMIHDIDIILSLVNSKVKKIDASGVAVISNEVDIANARIQFNNGAVANVTASRISQKKMRKMRLFQRNAYISIDFLQKVTEIYRLIDTDEHDSPFIGLPIQIGDSEQKKKIIYEKPVVEEGNALKTELSSFIKAVQHKEKPIVSGEDGRDALKVATEITNMIKNQLETLGLK